MTGAEPSSGAAASKLTGASMRRLIVATLGILVACGRPRVEPVDVVVRIDPTERFQTITGWEMSDQAGQEDRRGFPIYRDSLLQLAVDDLGLTRIRLWLRSGFEQSRDSWAEMRAGRLEEWRCARFATQNDNDDPFVINAAGFHFSQLDSTIEQLVLPMKRRLEARGERLFINANYTSFMRQCPAGQPYHHEPPEEYAEFVLASYLHMQNRFGFVPDAWEVILEPDNTPFWRGRQIGEAVAAAARRLEEHGFAPRFIAPSTTRAGNAPRYFDEMLTVDGVLPYIEELSYHRYGPVSRSDLEEIALRARSTGVRTSMLEHIGSGHVELHQDLRVAGVSAWQQFALAYGEKDEGGVYYLVKGASGASPRIEVAERTRYLRQYFRYLRPGAVRIGADSDVPQIDPLAFEHPDGRTVVVVLADRAARIQIRGLPPGRYVSVYTTRSATDVMSPAVTFGDSVQTMIPGGGVLTVFPEQ